MSMFISILGLVVIAANAAYANLQPTTDKRITLSLYFVGIVGAAVGKGYDRLKVLQSKKAIAAGLTAAAITAFVSVDPSMLAFLPKDLKSLLVIIAGLIVTLGKSLIGWNEPTPPDWRDNNALRSILACLIFAAVVSLTACGEDTASTARKFLNVLDTTSSQTGIALRTLPSLVDGKLLSPEKGILLNDRLAKVNTANKAAFTFLKSKIIFDDNGKATLVLNPQEQATAIALLDNLTDAADIILTDQSFGAFKYSTEIRALLPLLRDVIKLAANVKRALRASSSSSVEVNLDFDLTQLLNSWAT